MFPSRSTLRTRLGTRLADENVPLTQAQRLLRHSDPKLTANIYTRPTSTDLREAINRAAPRGASRVPVLYVKPDISGRFLSRTGAKGEIGGASPDTPQIPAERPVGHVSGADRGGGRKGTRTPDLVGVIHAL